MTPELKAAWLDALTRYRQTTNYLRRDAGFCCLGVLLDVVDPNSWMSLEVDGVDDNKTLVYTHALTRVGLVKPHEGRFMCQEDVVGMLPISTCEKLGLSYDLAVKLTEMNDNGENFEDIREFLRPRDLATGELLTEAPV